MRRVQRKYLIKKNYVGQKKIGSYGVAALFFGFPIQVELSKKQADCEQLFICKLKPQCLDVFVSLLIFFLGPWFHRQVFLCILKVDKTITISVFSVSNTK